jgi:hypothetical protein
MLYYPTSWIRISAARKIRFGPAINDTPATPGQDAFQFYQIKLAAEKKIKQNDKETTILLIVYVRTKIRGQMSFSIS